MESEPPVVWIRTVEMERGTWTVLYTLKGKPGVGTRETSPLVLTKGRGEFKERKERGRERVTTTGLG